jgi:thiosulfate dehydrogenase [quinone] large subunit
MNTTSSAISARHQSDDSGVAARQAGGRVPRALLVPLRIYLGVVFLLAAWPKLTADGGFAPRMEGFLRNVALENAHGFYRNFLENVVLPNIGLFTPLVVFGELFVALALLSGTVTRLAAGIAMFFLLNYMLAKGMWFWTPASNDAAMFFIALVVLVGAAGRSFGVDRLLHNKYPTEALW